MASQTPRRYPRVGPDSPLTVAIWDRRGLCVGYGVVANISPGGACVWTDRILPVGTHLSWRLSFSHPAEVHEVDGTVVWEGAGERTGDVPASRVGIAWDAAPAGCERRLRDLMLGAADESLTPRSLAALRDSRTET